MQNLKDFFKHNWLTLVLLIVGIGLASVTVLVAMKLKELGNQPVAPNAPASLPQAGEQMCASLAGGCALAFSVPTPTPTVSGTPTPTPSITVTPTPTPKIECGEKVCQTNADCAGLEYKECADIGSDNTAQKKCVINKEWFDGCTPPGPTNTPTPTSSNQTPTPTPTVAMMPAAGNTLTTVGFSAGAILLGVLGLVLLF